MGLIPDSHEGGNSGIVRAWKTAHVSDGSVSLPPSLPSAPSPTSPSSGLAEMPTQKLERGRKRSEVMDVLAGIQ